MAQDTVQGPKRLIEQEHIRLRREGSCQGDSLCLTTGELARGAVGVPSQTNKRGELFATLLAPPTLGQSKADIVPDAEVREK